MKYSHVTLIAASLISLTSFVGCSSAPHGHADSGEPTITTTASRHDINAGESVIVTANTYNLVGAKAVNWKVSPSGANLKAQSGTAGQTAIFSADQPGTYLVHAEAQTADGRWVSSETTITVNGTMKNIK